MLSFLKYQMMDKVQKLSDPNKRKYDHSTIKLLWDCAVWKMGDE
jgi:hypothetical protein